MNKFKNLVTVMITLAVILSSATVLAEQCCSAEKPSYLSESSMTSAARWEKTMADFARWDQKNAFPKDGVLFVGSSSIVGWKTRECLPTLPVINRGFGGSIYSDIIHHIDTLIFPYDPALIVFYSGDNDPFRGKTAEQIGSEVETLISMIREKLPETPILLMATKLSESRTDKSELYRKSNSLLKKISESDETVYFFDSMTPLLKEDGTPDAKYYKSDKLHLSDEGYKVWSDGILPVIESILKD